jgi:hypothetical protein
VVGVWVECVEHTPYLHVKGGGEDKVSVEKERGTHALN